MSPAVHYAKAESLLELANERVSANWSAESGELKSDILAAAQVHATLALVGATLATSNRHLDPQWEHVGAATQFIDRGYERKD